ncbi:uncharacterized protein LOC126772640 [Nymphalis io]|uniref:uncharacterized protein LOC126772640 n=1 Tax=Inachis io TaxID=171585 RepID=UPI002168CB0B|nr:uncharacterized protein LOC126772640 [Nymphalis io]
MELWILILCVIPTIVTTITISPNGNSPETKMIGGMIADTHKRNTETIIRNEAPQKNNIKPNIFLKANSSKLAINERYRRLIPYMTFYYANDLVTPTTETYNKNNVEVEQAKIVEAGTITPNERQPKIIYTKQRHNSNIPRYQGNRLTQFNIASSNPTKLFYKDSLGPFHYQNPPKMSHAHNPHLLEHNVYDNRDITYDRFIPKQIKAPSTPFKAPTRNPYLSLYQNDDYLPNVQYFSSDEGGSPTYKLIPYEQTPPVKTPNIVSTKQQYSFPALTQKESIYIKPRPSLHPQPFYTSQQVHARKPPTTISEIYYERRPQVTKLVEPVIESGFRPIVNSVSTTETPIYTSTQQDSSAFHHLKNEKQQEFHGDETIQIAPEDSTTQPQYVIEQSQYKQTQNSVTLAELLNSLQINKSIPKPITRENISASIRTLLQVLNTLKANNKPNEMEPVVVSSPKPFENSEKSVKIKPSIISSTTSAPQDLYEEPYLAPIDVPSQHLDDYPTGGASTQRFPLPVTSDEEGGTPGRPGIDYPILTLIPPTKFDCKTQRYKGFFADTETRCQVWHYCDLNGGQASFLCPNGTIFSQAALTCDWWFNVKCASTTQLYVLNESLYKYILPHSPKFPEDYSGPLVDKYLTLKFKEMEEQFKKNKNKKIASDKNDNEDQPTSNESTENSSAEENVGIDKTLVSQADVIVESSGNSGNVQRLQDD